MSEDNFNKISVVSQYISYFNFIDASEDYGSLEDQGSLLYLFSDYELYKNYKIRCVEYNFWFQPCPNSYKGNIKENLYEGFLSIEIHMGVGEERLYIGEIQMACYNIFDLLDISEKNRFDALRNVCAEDLLKYAINKIDDAMGSSRFSLLKDIEDKRWVINMTDLRDEWYNKHSRLSLDIYKYKD